MLYRHLVTEQFAENVHRLREEKLLYFKVIFRVQCRRIIYGCMHPIHVFNIQYNMGRQNIFFNFKIKNICSTKQWIVVWVRMCGSFLCANISLSPIDIQQKDNIFFFTFYTFLWVWLVKNNRMETVGRREKKKHSS